MISVKTLSLIELSLVFLPALAVLLLMLRWQLNWQRAGYALLRMLAQLLIIGYALVFLFAKQSGGLVLAVLVFMLLASAWIAASNVPSQMRQLLLPAVISISFGGLILLLLISVFTLRLQPWFSASQLIPLAGMVFANSMNSVSIAAERLYAELQHSTWVEARSTAFNAAMIPVINSLFAVGLVALPGMMTGQILSGVSPLIAARYQIVIMAMMFGSAGLSTACLLFLLGRKLGQGLGQELGQEPDRKPDQKHK